MKKLAILGVVVVSLAAGRVEAETEVEGDISTIFEYFLYEHDDLNGAEVTGRRGIYLRDLIISFAARQGVSQEHALFETSDADLSAYARRINPDMAEFDSAIRNALLLRGVITAGSAEAALAALTARRGAMSENDIIDFVSNFLRLLNEHYDFERMGNGRHDREVVTLDAMLANAWADVAGLPTRDIGVCRDMHDAARVLLSRGFGVSAFTAGFVTRADGHRVAVFSFRRNETVVADYHLTYHNYGFGPAALTQRTDSFGLNYHIHGDGTVLMVPTPIGVGLNFAVGGEDEDLDPGLHFDPSATFRLSQVAPVGRGSVGGFLYTNYSDSGGPRTSLAGLSSNLHLNYEAGHLHSATQLGLAFYGMDRRDEIFGGDSEQGGLYLSLLERLFLSVNVRGLGLRAYTSGLVNAQAMLNAANNRSEDAEFRVDGSVRMEHGAEAEVSGSFVSVQFGARVYQHIDGNRPGNPDFIGVGTSTFAFDINIGARFFFLRASALIRNLDTGRLYAQIGGYAGVLMPGGVELSLAVRRALSPELPSFVPSEGVLEGRIRRAFGDFRLDFIVRAAEGGGYSPEMYLSLNYMG